jgi:hypothetical protein
MSPKHKNVLKPWTLIECGGCNVENFYVFVSGYTIGININNNCSSMLNVVSGARFSSCGRVKFCMVCFQVGCVMLCKDGDDFGALPPKATKAWALGKSIPFLNRVRYYQCSSRWSKILTIWKSQKCQLSCIGLSKLCVERKVNNLLIWSMG